MLAYRKDTILFVRQGDGPFLKEDFTRANAEVHLLATDEISTLYEEAYEGLCEWSELYSKATPKIQRFGELRVTTIQAPDPTAPYKEPEKQAYTNLQEKLRALFAGMKQELQPGR